MKNPIQEPPEDLPSPKPDLFRLFTERVERIASTEFEGFVDAKLSEAILEEESRKLKEITKLLPKRISKAVAEMSAEDRKSEDKIGEVMDAEVDRFIKELESGKFHRETKSEEPK